ncbi:MAG: hypothetical protein SOY73_13105 [Blautia sp.]|nr:hypothetical protein [Blautia sp.]
MWRGTTPIHTFTFPTDVDLESMSVIFISYTQDGRVVVEKGKDDLEVVGNQIRIYLTQEDTLKFAPGTVKIQLRSRTYDGRAVASNIISTTVKDILKDGEI